MEESKNQIKTVDVSKLFKFELMFFRVLYKISKHTKVYLNVPEMIIHGFGFDTPTLICSDYRTGEMIVKENLTNEAINACFELFSSENAEGSPMALWKSAENSQFRDRCRLLVSYEECCFHWNFNFTRGNSQVIQRFVKTNTTSVLKSEYSLRSKIKTFLIRKKAVKQKSFVKKDMGRLKYLLLNNDECERFPVAASFVDNKMIDLVYLIEKYFIKEYNIKVLQMKCNWIQDMNEKIYFINLKEYKITSNFLNKVRTQQQSLATTLPTLNYIKKIKNIQDRNSISVIKLCKNQIWSNA